MHEDLSRRHDAPMGSNRAFGLVIAAGCVVIALAPLRHHQPIRSWGIVLGAAFAAVALVSPWLLTPLNITWTRFGQLLNRITNPVILGVVFYVVIAPIGMAMRLCGRDVLRLKGDRTARTYWTPRNPADAASSMRQQF